MTKRIFKLLPLLITSLITYYFAACSSGEEDKYYLLTKQDKKTISEFCECSALLGPLFEKIENVNDSANALLMLDSLNVIIKQFLPCIEKLKPLDKKGHSEEFEKQLIAYIKEKHPKCLSLFQEEKKAEKKEK